MGAFLSVLFTLLAAGPAPASPARPPASPSAAAPGGVVVIPKQTLFKGGEPAQVELRNGRSGAVYLPACGAVILAEFDGAEWSELPPAPCRAEGPAELLGAGARRGFSQEVPREGRHILRVGITYGVECRPGLPLDQAECRSIETTWSRFFAWTTSAPVGP